MLAGKTKIKCLNDLNFGVQLFIGQLEPTARGQFRVVGLESYNYNSMLISFFLVRVGAELVAGMNGHLWAERSKIFGEGSSRRSKIADQHPLHLCTLIRLTGQEDCVYYVVHLLN